MCLQRSKECGSAFLFWYGWKAWGKVEPTFNKVEPAWRLPITRQTFMLHAGPLCSKLVSFSLCIHLASIDWVLWLCARYCNESDRMTNTITQRMTAMLRRHFATTERNVRLRSGNGSCLQDAAISRNLSGEITNNVKVSNLHKLSLSTRKTQW